MPSELGSPNPLHDTSDTVAISMKARAEEIINSVYPPAQNTANHLFGLDPDRLGDPHRNGFIAIVGRRPPSRRRPFLYR